MLQSKEKISESEETRKAESKKEIDNEEIIEEFEKTKPRKKKMAYLNFLIIIAIFIGLFIYMLKVDGIENIINILHQVDYRWVIGGLICLMIYWLAETLTLHIPLKRMYPEQKIVNTLKVSMIGQLFNNITPFASGGQPMQAYELTKTGKRVSDSLSAMAIKFIINQTALVVSTIVVICFELEFFAKLLQDFLWVAIIGFAINIVAILVVVLAGMKKRIITMITNPIIKFLGKIHILKNSEKTMEKVNKSIDNFGEQFKVIKEEKAMVLKMFIVAVIQSFAYYSITYMVYKAFGNSGISFWQIIPTQAFLLLIMTFIPTPGSGLGAEGGFYILFNSIFKEGTINMSILFWRMYTFYLPIILGALFFIPMREKRD